MGISPFLSLDFFIRVLLLGSRLFYREYMCVNGICISERNSVVVGSNPTQANLL